MGERKPLGVDVPALVEALGTSLYTSPNVFVRELIANARDGLIRRFPASPAGGRIDLTGDWHGGRLLVADNGVGMTRDEIEKYLSTLAGSYTRLLRSSADEVQQEVRDQLGGYFGLGLYSSLIVGSQIELVTCSVENPHEAWRWICTSDPREGTMWHIEQAQRDEPGTTVAVQLRPEHQDAFLPESLLLELVRYYADLVQFPIYVNGSSVPANTRVAPWEAEGEAETAYAEYLRRRRLLEDPADLLTVYPLPAEAEGLSGFLYVLRGDRRTRPGSEGLEVYCRRLFVFSSAEVLPEALDFIRGCVNCDWLDLTLSREQVVTNRRWQRMCDLVRQAAADMLRDLSEHRKGTLRTIMQTHGTAIKYAAASDPSLAEVSESLVTLPRVEGGEPWTLPELREQARAHGSTVAYLDAPPQLASALLLQSLGVPVVDVTSKLDFHLLAQFCSSRGFRLVRADELVQEYVEYVPDARWAPLEALFAAAAPGLEAAAVRIDAPVAVVISHPRERVLADMIAELRATGQQLPEEFEEEAAALEEKGAAARSRALVNINHPLVQLIVQVMEAQGITDELRTIAAAVVASARLVSEHLTVADQVEALAHQNQAFELALRSLMVREQDDSGGE